MIALALFFLPIPGASLPTFDGHPPFDESEGMRSLFGHYEANSGSAKFTVPDNSAFDLNGSGFKAGDELVVRPFWKSTYEVDGVPKTVLLTYAVPFDPDWKPIVAGDQPFSCHACAPLIGAAVFTWSDMKWKIETSQSFVIRDGAGGLPPSAVRLIKIGPHRTGVELINVYEGQGTTTTSKQIIALSDSSISRALNLLVGEDNQGGCDLHQPSMSPAVTVTGKPSPSDREQTQITTTSTPCSAALTMTMTTTPREAFTMYLASRYFASRKEVTPGFPGAVQSPQQSKR